MTAQRVFDAPTAPEGPIPAYKIVEMEGPFTAFVSIFDEKEKVIKKEPVQHEKAYMVFFPRGHSHRYFTLEALRNANFGDVVPLINMNQEVEANKEHPVKTIRQPIEKA